MCWGFAFGQGNCVARSRGGGTKISSLFTGRANFHGLGQGRVGSGRVGSGRVGSGLGRVGSRLVEEGRVGSGPVWSGRVRSCRISVHDAPTPPMRLENLLTRSRPYPRERHNAFSGSTRLDPEGFINPSDPTCKSSLPVKRVGILLAGNIFGALGVTADRIVMLGVMRWDEEPACGVFMAGLFVSRYVLRGMCLWYLFRGVY